MAKATRTAREKAAKSPGSLPPRYHRVVGVDNAAVKVDWDKKTGAFRGQLVSAAEASAAAADAHPTTVSPVPGDPTQVIRCVWDETDNQYRCSKEPASGT